VVVNPHIGPDELDWALGACVTQDATFESWYLQLMFRRAVRWPPPASANNSPISAHVLAADAAGSPAVTPTDAKQQKGDKSVPLDTGVTEAVAADAYTQSHNSNFGLYEECIEPNIGLKQGRGVGLGLGLQLLDPAYIDDAADEEQYQMALTPLALKKYKGDLSGNHSCSGKHSAGDGESGDAGGSCADADGAPSSAGEK
jgi:hypothetical protein